jgi:hypothetical protein
MEKKNIQVASGGISFTGLLLIVFIVLKLCGVISWSWWWVISPFWIPIALILVIGLFSGILSFIGKAINRSKKKRRFR